MSDEEQTVTVDVQTWIRLQADALALERLKVAPKRLLLWKLTEIYRESKRIPKNGWNEFHKYKFTTDEDVVEALRPLFARHRVAWWPTLVSSTRERIDKGNGKATWLTTVKLRVLFACPDTGEELASEWDGTAYDEADKGIYKAYTGALKYALQMAGMQSSGDDPERVSGNDRRDAERDAARAARMRAPDAPEAAKDERPKWSRMLDAFARVGISRQQVEAKMGTRAEQLSVQQLEELSGIYHACVHSPAARQQSFPKEPSAADALMTKLKGPKT